MSNGKKFVTNVRCVGVADASGGRLAWLGCGGKRTNRVVCGLPPSLRRQVATATASKASFGSTDLYSDFG
jgi:hypothetical protein